MARTHAKRFTNIELILVVQLQSRVPLSDLMNSSTSDFPVLHYLPEFALTHNVILLKIKKKKKLDMRLY